MRRTCRWGGIIPGRVSAPPPQEGDYGGYFVDSNGDCGLGGVGMDGGSPPPPGIMRFMAKLLLVDGDVKEVAPFKDHVWDLSELYALLECDYIEVVYRGPRIPPGFVLIVDEEGALRGKMVNRAASVLAGQRIVGHALLTTREEMGG